MSRVLRTQKPGAVFHITSRTHSYQPWFGVELRARIAGMIADGILSAGAHLIAYAVMPNHFHIVAAQGVRDWGWTMKPICQRIALLVQRHHQIKGHVFEHRYRSKECDSADYMRTAILYTHHNPVKAKICTSVGDYVWSSHNEYCSKALSPGNIVVRDVLRLFAAEHSAALTYDVLLRNYLAHVEWWCAKKDAEERGEMFTTPAPPAYGGDMYFREKYASSSAKLFAPPSDDLRDRARRILAHIDPDCDMELIRRPYCGHQAAEIRRQLIAALHSCGYRGCDVARFLRVSPTLVSRIASFARWTPACGDS